MKYTLFLVLLTLACSAPVQNYNSDIDLIVNEPTTVGDLSLTLTKLIYSPCPKGSVCVWVGIDIELIVEKGDKKELLRFSAVPSEQKFEGFTIQLRSATKENIIVKISPLN